MNGGEMEVAIGEDCGSSIGSVTGTLCVTEQVCRVHVRRSHAMPSRSLLNLVSVVRAKRHATHNKRFASARAERPAVIRNRGVNGIPCHSRR